MRRLFSTAILLSALMFAAKAFPQSLNFAALSGHIEDPNGNFVAGATIQIREVERNQPSETTSDERGRFRFSYLPIGDYEVRIQQPGFQPALRRIKLSIGQAADISIKLLVAAITTTVTVTDDTPIIETLRTQIADTIATAEIESLPLNGRNYLDLALLVPGVSKTNTGNNERFAETSAVPGTGISVAGQRNLGNGFVIDGLSANDDAADLAGTFFSQEVIRELQVVQSGGSAEFGRAYSGVLNVVTQSGTNQWHGSVYGFLRSHRFDATNVFGTVDPVSGRRMKSSLTQGQYGTSVGGPLKRDRVFLFTNIEREDLNRSGFITISPGNVAAVNARLDQIGYPTRLTTGGYPTGDNRTSFLAKTDFNRSDRTRIAVRYSLYDIISPNARNVGALSALSRGTVVEDRDQTVAANVIRVLPGNSLNETRFQFTRSRFSAPGNDQIGPAVSISGVANFGASTSSPTGRDIDLIEIANNYSVIKGRNSFKAGVDFIHNRVNIVFPATSYGTYSFSNLENFLAGTYTAFGQAFGKTDWLQSNPNLGWFVQDEWRIRHDLTLNAGLRHDVQWLVDPIATQKANFSPRLGLSYAPGNRKTVVRGGFGLYYDRIPLRAVANAQRGAGTDYKAISLQRTQSGAPAFASKLSSFPAGALFNLATIDNGIKPAYGIQANLEVEHEISHRVAVSAGYVHLRGMHIIMQRNLNVPTLTAAQDPVNLGRPNPSIGNISQYSGQGDSYYDGMTLALEHRGSGWASARVSYTVSKAIDNTGNAFFSSPQNNFNIRDDRGLSDNDQRYRLAVSGQYRVPRSMENKSLLYRVANGFQLSPIFTYGSPNPFNILTGGQTLQTTNARPAGVGRNTGKGFKSATLDLRLSRKFQIAEHAAMELMAESFNVLNHANFQFSNNIWGLGTTPAATFGRPTAANDPRQIQFGLRLKL
jgi:hypothetical protein